MVEPIMYLAIGFLLSMLCGLAIVPLVHNRAVRLTTRRLAELGKKSDAINRMKIELGEKNATIFALEAREKAIKEQLRATEEEFTAKTELLRHAEQALSDKQAELGRINTELNTRSMTADSRQIELVAVRTQVEELKSRVGDAEKEFSATQARL